MIKVEREKEKVVVNRLLDMFVEDTKQKRNSIYIIIIKELYGTKEDLEEKEDFFPFLFYPLLALDSI
jgi:hypothetical protein